MLWAHFVQLPWKEKHVFHLRWTSGMKISKKKSSLYVQSVFWRFLHFFKEMIQGAKKSLKPRKMFVRKRTCSATILLLWLSEWFRAIWVSDLMQEGIFEARSQVEARICWKSPLFENVFFTALLRHHRWFWSENPISPVQGQSFTHMGTLKNFKVLTHHNTGHTHMGTLEKF